jgi:RNA polymerase sigma factor (sigma-70 family)
VAQALKADDASLARLMALSQQGDQRAYATLLAECQKWLCRYYSRRIVPHHLDDLVQDTLLSLHRKRASYDPNRPFLPWLAAIARFRWVDHLRKVYRAAEDEFDEGFAADSEEPAITARISLERMFSYLPPAQEEVIRLVKIGGLSISEAANTSGQSESLVKVNIHRGLKKLAGLIEKA